MSTQYPSVARPLARCSQKSASSLPQPQATLSVPSSLCPPLAHLQRVLLQTTETRDAAQAEAGALRSELAAAKERLEGSAERIAVLEAAGREAVADRAKLKARSATPTRRPRCELYCMGCAARCTVRIHSVVPC